jgi:hypothetical protein
MEQRSSQRRCDVLRQRTMFSRARRVSHARRDVDCRKRVGLTAAISALIAASHFGSVPATHPRKPPRVWTFHPFFVQCPKYGISSRTAIVAATRGPCVGAKIIIPCVTRKLTNYLFELRGQISGSQSLGQPSNGEKLAILIGIFLAIGNKVFLWISNFCFPPPGFGINSRENSMIGHKEVQAHLCSKDEGSVQDHSNHNYGG